MAASFALQGKLGLDSKDFVKGAKQAEKAIDGVADELEELPDTAEGAGADAGSGSIGGLPSTPRACGHSRAHAAA